MYCCSCCYFCHPSWSWTQQQQRLIYAMRSLTQTQVSSGPKSNEARFFPLRMSHAQSVTLDTLCFFPKFVSQSNNLFVCLNQSYTIFFMTNSFFAWILGSSFAWIIASSFSHISKSFFAQMECRLLSDKIISHISQP